MSPLLTIDRNGLPRQVAEGDEEKSHLAQKVPLLPEAPAVLTDRAGSVVATLATGRGGTMQAVAAIGRQVLDADLLSPVRERRPFVASRENQRAGPEEIKLDPDGIRPLSQEKGETMAAATTTVEATRRKKREYQIIHTSLKLPEPVLLGIRFGNGRRQNYDLPEWEYKVHIFGHKLGTPFGHPYNFWRNAEQLLFYAIFDLSVAYHVSNPLVQMIFF